MGVKTSSDLFVRKEKIGAVYSGPKPYIRDDENATVKFRFPTPVHGKSGISLDIGEVDKNEQPTYKKIELIDGIFEIPKDWKEEKKSIYSLAFLKAGFEKFVSLDIVEPIKKEVLYFAGHPDNKENEKVTGVISVTVGKKEIELDCVEGMVTTDNEKIYKALIKKGYLEAKLAEEVK